MARFEYEGIDAAGVRVSGAVEAMDRCSAISILAGRGQFATRVEQGRVVRSESAKDDGGAVTKAVQGVASVGSAGRITSKDVLSMTNQLGAALGAGLPLLDCLRIIEKQMDKASMKALLADLAGDVSSGKSLSEAMGRHGKVFSTLYLSMIRVGETGGMLEDTTKQLTGLLKRDEQIKGNIRNAMAYPLFVLGVGVASVILVMTWILPTIVETISEHSAQVPLITRVLMGVSGFISGYWWLIVIVVVGSVFGFRKWLETSEGRLSWDRFKLRLPLVGNVVRVIAVGRFARTLGALTKGGITILEALSVVRDTLGNELLAREVDQAAQKVKGGASLAEPLAVSGTFGPLLVQIVSVGEQTGTLDELLLSAADTFDEQADATITRFMSILPAVLVVLLAVVIGFLVAAILLPIVVMELGAV